MSAHVIDLNADLGEGLGRWVMTDDAALLDVVTSANVACGFHAGDAPTMRRVCDMAAERGVAIGAHVAYRDLAGFGRREMAVPPQELAAEVAYQIGALEVFARAAGTEVSYVKPHGALYNRAVWDHDQAAAIIEGVLLAGARPVLGLPGSALLQQAEAQGCAPVTEAFADRAYLGDGSLAPRSRDGAVLVEADAVVAQAVRLATGEAITDIDGNALTVQARSVCVHGDTPGAVEHARQVRAALAAAEVDVRRCVP
ncbi:LamB/YcsF family protein [Demequina sp. B12]|uniref:LamB/YcsF family protein n=1 Tax=Demequina sp. B12 TaxID=2992757 RepID=UPI00237C3A01|nr:5-oxoprolinase subunit PxpA [Demequina sp. B12]MDE0571907.1 LamB/YcsF family protein [Demequina sp. B12]